MRPAFGVAREIGQAGVQSLAFQGKWIRKIEGFELASGNHVGVSDGNFASGERGGPLFPIDVRYSETRMKANYNGHGVGAQVGDDQPRFQHAIRKLVGHLVFLGERPLRHEVGIAPEPKPAGDMRGVLIRLDLGNLPKRRVANQAMNG